MDRCSPSTRCSPIHQVEHLQLTRRVEHPTRGDIDVLRPPLTFSDTPARVRSGPPADGEHTREVLAELGYDAVEIDELHASGAVGSRALRPQEHEG